MASKSNSTARTTSAHTDLKVADEPTFTPEQAEEMRQRVDSARVLGRDAVIEQAKVTHAVVSLGMIGKGKVWESQEDYATALGVSGGTISGLKTLGKAMSLGLAPEHPAWDAVYAKRQSLGKVASKATRLNTITAEAKRLAKPRAVASASEPSKTPEPTADALESVQDALQYIREAIPTMDTAEATILANSLSTLLSDAQEQAKRARKSA